MVPDSRVYLSLKTSLEKNSVRRSVDFAPPSTRIQAMGKMAMDAQPKLFDLVVPLCVVIQVALQLIACFSESGVLDKLYEIEGFKLVD